MYSISFFKILCLKAIFLIVLNFSHEDDSHVQVKMMANIKYSLKNILASWLFSPDAHKKKILNKEIQCLFWPQNIQ